MNDIAQSLYDVLYKAVREGVRDGMQEASRANQYSPSVTPSTARDLLTAAELEERTGIPTATWRWWAHKGKGPPSVKVGRRRLWRWPVVQAWIDAQG
jgi:prophage regulatory protein